MSKVNGVATPDSADVAVAEGIAGPDPAPVDASDGIADDAPLVEGGEMDPERARLYREAQELRNQVADLRTKLDKVSELDMGIIDAGIDVDRIQERLADLDRERKELKEDLKKAVAHLRACVIRRRTGQKELFDPREVNGKSGPATAKAASAPTVDVALEQPISILSAKEMKKIVGKEEFQSAKDRGEPIGMTEKQLETLEAQGWETIGKLEKAMRENAWWHRDLKGYGPDKVDRLTITLAAFRRKHPMLETPAAEVPEPASDTKSEEREEVAPTPEWEMAAQRLRDLSAKADGLAHNGPGDCIEFMQSVSADASSMLANITEHESVTEDQLTTITNWEVGVSKWEPKHS